MPNIRPESRHGFAHDYFNNEPNNQPITLSTADTGALDWMQHGNCRPPHPPWVLEQIATVPDATTITDLFFPDGKAYSGRRMRAVRNICADCPVRRDCLDYVLSHPIPRGSWAGLSEKQIYAEQARRNRIRRAFTTLRNEASA